MTQPDCGMCYLGRESRFCNCWALAQGTHTAAVRALDDRDGGKGGGGGLRRPAGAEGRRRRLLQPPSQALLLMTPCRG